MIINNQYLKLEIDYKDIKKINNIPGINCNLLTSAYRYIDPKLIEDLEIDVEEPNIIICFGGKKNKMNFNNIYYSVKTIITDQQSVIDNDIPEYIENIICDRYDKIFDVEFEKRNEDKLIKLIEKISDKEIKGLNNILLRSCEYKFERLALKLVDRLDSKRMKDEKIFTTICKNDMTELGIKMIEKENSKINLIDSILYVCKNRNIELGIRILEKMKENIEENIIIRKNKENIINLVRETGIESLINKVNELK